MINRYSSRQIVKNSEEMYQNTFLERNVKFINQYETPIFTFPDEKSAARLTLNRHVWSVGDRYYKLAYEYYGDAKDWWVIAKFNNKPTESHVKIGDILYIPTPLQEVLNLMKG